MDTLKCRQFTDVTYIRGATLERFLHDPEHSIRGWDWYWIYKPTVRMMAIQCDGCVKRHSIKNLDCSANHRERSPATNPNTLYSFRNLKRGKTLKNIRLSYRDVPHTRLRACLVKTF